MELVNVHQGNQFVAFETNVWVFTNNAGDPTSFNHHVTSDAVKRI